jgi:putative transposase
MCQSRYLNLPRRGATNPVVLGVRNIASWEYVMSQSLVKNLIHLVYSTKNHQPWVTKAHRSSLFSYQAGIYQEWDSPALAIGGAKVHVQALFALSRNHALKKIVEAVKKGSSKWAKTDGPKNPDFYWQAGYGAFSVSQSNVGAVQRYIENQEEHHRKITFQDELRALYNRHGIAFDERYVWD